MDRKAIITQHLKKNGLGLEIGPSHDPVMPKRGGHQVHVVDHMTREQLREKYRDHGVNIDNIEDVDHVWAGGRLSTLIANHGSYDWIIASHVIEHVPDPIRFIADCMTLLKPGGVLSFAIPDQRYCFDYFRPLSTTGGVIQAYLEERERHTPGQVFDSFSFAGKMNGSIAWRDGAIGTVEFLHPDGFGAHMLKESQSSADYIDIHAWVFTPSSFRLIVSDLVSLGYLSLEEQAFTPSIGCEFFLSYRNDAPTKRVDRLALTKMAKDEVRQTYFP
jgi:SAM-dependent methyltransferase